MKQFLPAEKNYDFRKRLAVLHPLRLRSDAEPYRPETETLVGPDWKIVCTDPGNKVLMHAARDLQDYFRNSMKLELELSEMTEAPCLVIGVREEKNSRTARIDASDKRIFLTGATPREAAQACYRMEDELNLRGLPAVRKENRTYTRMFSPRMTHSGWELEQFPDVYLDHVAHAGMDAIIIFISEPPDITRNGRLDLPRIVGHAEEFGLDVYVYPHVHVQAAECHPLDPGAKEYYDALYGSIVRNAPGIKGMVFVGESVAFPSRDPVNQGFWWKRVPGSKRLNGFWPNSDWVDWLELVRDVTRRYRTDLDIVFWTYNWSWTPEPDRLALLEKIPTDVSLLVTYEMGGVKDEKDGVPAWAADYTISVPGPSPVFASEAEVAARRGIRLLSMTNTGGMTWDCGVVPYIPAPFCWLERCGTIRESARRWNLAGLMESHHYGFTPGFIAELNKLCFTAEFDLEREYDSTLAALAARDFGRKNVPAVVSAFRDWSSALLCHSAHGNDQYGPLRVGPVYPFVLPGEQIPEPLHPVYTVNGGIRHGNGWKYVSSSYSYPENYLDASIRLTEKEMNLLKSGCDKLSAILPDLDPERLPDAVRLAGVGEFLYHTVRTTLNVKKFYRAGLSLKERDELPVRAEMKAILADEEENVRETIPLVTQDSRLGWEPTMLYIADPENLAWKLRQLASIRARL